jgi:hypothetical protein
MAFQTLMVDGPGALAVGDDARVPLRAGQVILVHGIFDDGADAGEALGVVIRPGTASRSYMVKFVEAANDYWSWALFDKDDSASQTYVRLMTEWAEPDRDQSGWPTEWLSAWRVLAEKDKEYDLAEVDWLSNARGCRKSIGFIREMLSSERMAPQVTTPQLLHKKAPLSPGEVPLVEALMRGVRAGEKQ